MQTDIGPDWTKFVYNPGKACGPGGPALTFGGSGESDPGAGSKQAMLG
jgi:hypothetical protein